MALNNSVNATRKRMVIAGLDDEDELGDFNKSTIFRADDITK